MMLYDRIIRQGTLNEPKGKPEPQFALASTVNWMKALRLIVEDQNIGFKTALSFYASQGKRGMSFLEENTVLEQLFLGLHHLSALNQFRAGTTSSDYARVGILAWYYGISNAASAMIAAQCGSFQEDHAGTAQQWDEQIATRGLAMVPFSWRVSSLVKGTYEAEIDALRGVSEGKPQTRPVTRDDAIGAAVGYLSGSARWYAWKTEENLRLNRAFKDLQVKDFRTKQAQALRDQWLARKSVGFVHQASRYRGKANYREALFLAYGTSTESGLTGFIEDMHAVLSSFLAMAGAFACRKLGNQLWLDFVADVDAKKAFTASPNEVWK